jgi:hypothetical protein
MMKAALIAGLGAAAVVIHKMNKLPKPGQFCVYDKKDLRSSPDYPEDASVMPLACFSTFQEAFYARVQENQGVNVRGTKRFVICSDELADHLKKMRTDGLFVTQVGECSNHTYPGIDSPWDLDPEDWESGNIPQPEALDGMRKRK